MLKKFLSALLLLGSAVAASAIVVAPPAACDPNNAAYNPGRPIVKAMIGGSSAMWVTTALGAHNRGLGIGSKPPVHHFVSNGSANRFIMTDYRPVSAGVTTTAPSDKGNIWIVWDSTTQNINEGGTVKAECTPVVWAYISLDSVVGNRAFFGGFTGQTLVAAPASYGSNWNGGGSLAFGITLWAGYTAAAGLNDEAPAENVKALFGDCSGTHNAHYDCYATGYPITAGATDIDPADAFFASNRNLSPYAADSNAVSGTGYGTSPSNLNFTLGQSTNPLICSGGASGLGGTPNTNVAYLLGNKIKSDNFGWSGTGTAPSQATFNVVGFNIFGYDPFTCVGIPTWAPVSVGASPIVFVYSDKVSPGSGVLSGLKNATPGQLSLVFSGTNHDASVFGGGLSGSFSAALREPLSGTMNTTEENVFRHPNPLGGPRYSQELNINGAVNNPIYGATSSGHRYRAIGTGEEVNTVKFGYNFANNEDVMGYTFFSYGNVNPIASSGYYYIALNNVDPIWHSHAIGSDQGQPATEGSIPGIPNFTGGTNADGATYPGCTTFPCPEWAIWTQDSDLSVWINGLLIYNAAPTSGVAHGLSYPNVRKGKYSAFSILRLLGSSVAYTLPASAPGPLSGKAMSATLGNLNALVATGNAYAVTTVPDYIPYNKVVGIRTGTLAETLDPGLQLIRSHFGCPQGGYWLCGGTTIGGTARPNVNTADIGRDAGGMVLPYLDATTGWTRQDADGTFLRYPLTDAAGNKVF